MQFQANPPFAQQPLRFLYTTWTIAKLPATILVMLLYYTPRRFRPNRKWTLHQAIGAALFEIYWQYLTTVRYRTPKTLKPGGEKDQFIVIEPSSAQPGSTLPYRGIVTKDPEIIPGPIGGVWYTQAPPPPEREIQNLVVIHFHGGAYVLGGARKLEGGWGPVILSEALGCSVLLPQYRLAVEPKSCFPAALQDGITAYSYVLNVLKVQPQNVVLSGDSAGGNIVMAMLRYLSSESALPLPRAALLWSPWLNLAITQEETDSHRSRKTDWIFGSLACWGSSAYTPPDWLSSDPYLSPLNNEFRVDVPIFVQTGTSELMYDEHKDFVEGMRGQGNDVELLEIPDATHDIFAAGQILGFEKEAKKAAAEAAVFVKRAEKRKHE